MSRAPRFPFSRGNPQAEPGMRDYASRDLPPHVPLPRPQSAPATDPLSELARLIGQTDPFGEAARNAAPRHDDRASGWPGSPPPQYSTGLPPLMPEYRDERRPPQDQYAAPAYVDPNQQAYDPRYDQQQSYAAPHAQYGQGRADAPYYGDNGQLMQHDQYAADPYGYEERRPRRRSGMIIVAAVLGLAMVGTAGAYAYRTMFNGGMSGPPPLIKADTTPNKVVPAQTGATDTSGKQIYDRIGANAGQGERVVSREEQPVDVKATATRPSYPANAGQQMPTQFSSQPAAGASGTLPQTQPAPAAQTGSQTEPRKVRTVTIRPDQQGSAASATAAQAAPATQRAAPANARAAAGNAPLSLTPQGAAAAPERVATANTASATDTSSAVPSGVGFMVQISAQKSQAEANSAFKSAQSKYPNLLGSYQVVLRKKQTAKGTFYGAQVGPFESRDDASGLCAQIKTAGGNCLVEKN